jgi:hypothetical protein
VYLGCDVWALRGIASRKHSDAKGHLKVKDLLVETTNVCKNIIICAEILINTFEPIENKGSL